MLSRKTRYAIMAMTALAESFGKGPLPMSRIAESKSIPIRFLEGILLQLKKKGILESIRGVDGGYALKRPPETISLIEVLRVTEGSMSYVSCSDCVSKVECEFGWNPDTCGIRRIFSDVYVSLLHKMETTTLKDLVIG